MSLFLSILSQIVGWIYFTAWSVSFYPQVHLNYQLKNIEGFSLNYGFLAYFLYSLWGYLDPSIMPGTVAIQDIAYPGHALVLTLILLIQCFYYDRRFFSLISWWVKIFLILAFLHQRHLLGLVIQELGST